MILFKVNLTGVTFRKFKRDTPWAVDVNRVTHRFKTTQCVKIIAFNCKTFG